MAAPAAPARLRSDTGDSEPLLTESENGLLRRVISGIQPSGTWRRWFSRNSSDANSSAGEATSAEPDLEAGSATAAAESPRTSAAVAFLDTGATSQAATALPRQQRRQLLQQPYLSTVVVAADEARDLEAGEITAAPSVHDSPAITPSSAAAAQAAPVRSSSFGPTLGERVASLGVLLGLGSRQDAEGGDDIGSSKVGSGRKRFFSSSGGSNDPERGLSRSSSGSQPMCLICLEPLTSEDFLSGEAMSLDCQCRGDLALRHKACAIKWSRVKGDAICDICKSPVANLPTPSPRASTPGSSDVSINIEEYAADHHPGMAMGLDVVPGNADLLFDCIRVTWVAMIVGILFFEMSLSTALWCGMIAGIGYTLFVRAMYKHQLAALQAEAARVAAGGATPPPPPMQTPPPMLHHVVG